MKTGVTVGDAMTRGVLVVSPETDISECAKRMVKKGVGCVLVRTDHKLIGIITEKDVVDKVVAKGYLANKVKAKDIMSTKLTTVTPDEDIYGALITMGENDCRRLPVVHKNKLIGVLTVKDILRVEPQLFDVISEKYRIREMSRKPLRRARLEGECEECGNYGVLHNVEGSFLCGECIEAQ